MGAMNKPVNGSMQYWPSLLISGLKAGESIHVAHSISSMKFHRRKYEIGPCSCFFGGQLPKICGPLAQDALRVISSKGLTGIR